MITDMNILTIINMAFVLGIVWGGLAFFLSRAVKYEKLKQKNGEE
ncbi:MAG: MetS family NSS transporter small subunit [Ignavibacteriaceae bacterium]|nr:MetS family NSS transporter small subunit [Ignavibacteriaceae bacterium]